MRISDWSSDVCSSDLGTAMAAPTNRFVRPLRRQAPLRTGGAASIDRGKSMTYGISGMAAGRAAWRALFVLIACATLAGTATRSEEHTSELQSLMRISYAVFCLKKKNTT